MRVGLVAVLASHCCSGTVGRCVIDRLAVVQGGCGVWFLRFALEVSDEDYVPYDRKCLKFRRITNVLSKHNSNSDY